MNIELSFSVEAANQLRSIGIEETASSLSRVLKHAETNNIGALTAFRKEYSLQENRERNKKLRQKLRKAGFGITKVSGDYVEDGVPVKEESFLVTAPPQQKDHLFTTLKNLATEYDQESVLFKPVDSDNAALHFFNGENKGEVWDVGEFHASAITQFISTLSGKGKSFEFRESTDKEKKIKSDRAKRLAQNVNKSVGEKSKQAEQNWWKNLTRKEQEAYLEKYPNSTKKITAPK